MLAELEELRDLAPLRRLHLLENLAGVLLGQIAQQVGGRVRIHLFEDVRCAILVERFDDRHLDVRIELLERLGRDPFVDGFEHRLAFGGRQVLDDVRYIGGVEPRESFIRDLELDAACRIGFEEVDELPGDHARRDLFKQEPQGEGRDDAL